MKKWIKIPVRKNESDFLQLFKHKEFNQLAGLGSEKIIKLSGIIFITLLTLSYAIGSLEQLRAKMDNPYTNWVDMPLSSTGINGYDSLQVIYKYFSQKENKDRFLLNDVRGNVSTTAIFVQPTDYTVQLPNKARTIEPGEKLLEAILSPKNIAGKAVDPTTVFNDHPCGVIVKQRLLERLGMADWQSVQKIPMLFRNDLIFVDVVGIVKDLPDYCDLVCTPRFYNLFLNGSLRPHDTGVINQDTTNIVRLVTPEKDKNQIEQLARTHFKQMGFQLLSVNKKTENLTAQTEQFQYELIFNHNNIPSTEAQMAFWQQHKKLLAPTVLWYCSPKQTDELIQPYALAFNFNDLGEIRAFKEFMGSRFKMNVNLAQVEAKDNFKKVTRITWVVSTTLFVFGMLSIVLFITNLLHTHLENMRPNLGTLKAFGLKDGWLKNTYNLVIAYFLVYAFALAIVPLSLVVMPASLIWNDAPFSLLNWPILIAIGLIFLISLYFARKTTGKIIQSTPGDLIYGR